MTWFSKKKSTGELLFEAARIGDQQAVEKHWTNAKSSDLEYINDKGSYLTHGFTPLMIAASMGHAPIVKFFMELEGNINHIDSHHGWTPLIEAAGNGHEAVVRLLINEPGLKVNVQDTAGKTALHWAASYSRLEILKLLLAHPHIEVNLRNQANKIAEDETTSDGYKLFCVHRGVDPTVLDTNTTSTPTPTPTSTAPDSTNTAALQERVTTLEKTVASLSAHLNSSQQALRDHITASEARFAELSALINSKYNINVDQTLITEVYEMTLSVERE